jgi:hypothetical protein
MNVCIYTHILPRLEVQYLEEWIEHHMALGVDRFYIYDNGYMPDDNSVWVKGCEELPEDQSFKWKKKPNADYCEDLTDQQVHWKLMKIVKKYKGRVFRKDWSRDAQPDDYPRSQTTGYEDCTANNESDYWIHIDVDEFLVFKEHDTIQQFIRSYPKKVTAWRFTQRVFEERSPDKPVREIYKWGYELRDRSWKVMCISDIQQHGVHKTIPKYGESKKVPAEVACFFHYRGHPAGKGDPISHGLYQNSVFDKIDPEMKRYTRSVKKALCIYTCAKDQDKLDFFKNSWLYKQIVEDPTVTIFEVTAGHDKEEVGDGYIHLTCEEDYLGLSVKTYEMIRALHRKGPDFDIMIKLDSTTYIEAEEGHNRGYMNRISRMLLGKINYYNYGGFKMLAELRTLSPSIYREGWRSWAEEKEIENLDLSKKPRVGSYYVGKLYYLSRDVCAYIANNGEEDAHYFKKHLAGSEDSYIGRQFLLYKGGKRWYMHPPHKFFFDNVFRWRHNIIED